MENKKTFFTIFGIGLGLGLVLISIIIVLIDSQQSTINYQNTVINEHEQTIIDQSENLSKFENDAEYKRVKDEIEKANRLLLSQQDQIYENLSKIDELQNTILSLNSTISTKDELVSLKQQTIDTQIEELNQKEDEITQLNATISSQAEILASHDQTVESYKQTIINLNFSVDELKQNATKLSKEISEKVATIQTQSQTITTLESKVENMQSVIAEQTLIIEASGLGQSLGDSSLIELLKKKQQQVDEQQELIQTQDETIASQKDLIEGYLQKLTEVESVINAKDQLIDDQSTLLAEREQTIFTQQDTIDQLNGLIESLREELEQKDQTISALEDQIENSETSFCVSFVADGTLVNRQYVAKGAKLTTIPTVPAKDGYDGVWSEFDTIEDNTLIYAIYTPKKYKLIYNLDLLEYYSFKNAYFAIDDIPYTIDFWKNTLSYEKRVPIIDNKFSLNGITYTLDQENSVVSFGDTEYPIEDMAFMMDNIYYIKEGYIGFNTTVNIVADSFVLDDKTYLIDTINHKIITHDIQIDIQSYYCQPLNYLIYPMSNTLKSKAQNSKEYSIENNIVTILNTKYTVDYANKRLFCILGASTLKSDASDLPTEFSYGDKLIKLPKNVAKYVKNISFDGKQTSETNTSGYNKPIGWELNAIKCSPSFDDEYLYFVPLEYTDLIIHVVWGS